MKTVAKLVVILGLVASFSANAVAGEAVIDTGKGGLRAVLTIDGMEGPYDFAKNKGPSVSHDPRLAGGEVMFGGKVGDTAILADMLLVMHSKDVKPGDKPITAGHLANEMLKAAGFSLDRATKIDGPRVDIPGAIVVTLKAFGSPIFEQERKGKRSFVIVQAVSFPGNSKGYAIMAEVTELNAAIFDADPSKYEKLTKGGFMPLFRGLQVTQN